MSLTYEIVHDGRAIHCKLCNRTSWNREDVRHRFCVGCDVFHDDLRDCYWCGEPVLPSERRAPINLLAHWECGLRSAVGGLNHLNGACSCCGGTLPPDPEGVTRREAARMAAQAWVARNPSPFSSA